MPDSPPVHSSQPEAAAASLFHAPSFASAPAVSPTSSDPRTLAELENIFGRARLLDLLARLKVEIMQRLRSPPEERVALGQDAHTLLSVSGSLGFLDLSRRCSDMERDCLRGADLAAPLAAARHAAARAIAAIALIEERA
jgi:HPt (histidine-containing phosphotransfer) domain-containing protein